MLTMKKFLLASAAALPLVTGAAFAQTAPTTPASPPAVNNSTTATTPSTTAPATQAAPSAKQGVGDKAQVETGKSGHSDATAGKNATLGNKSADSHDKLDKSQKSTIAKKNAKAHEGQKGAKVDEKGTAGTSTQTAKKPADAAPDVPSKKL